MKFSLFPCRNCTSCIFYISHQHVLKIRNFAYDYSEHGKYIMLSLHECYWCYLSIFFIYVLFQNNKTNDSLQMCVVEETFIFYWRESIVAQTLWKSIWQFLWIVNKSISRSNYLWKYTQRILYPNTEKLVQPCSFLTIFNTQNLKTT